MLLDASAALVPIFLKLIDMVYGSSLLTTLTLALFVAANPVVIRDSLITLPIVKRIGNNGTVSLLARDQARVQGLRRFAQQKTDGTLSEDAVISAPAQNQAVDYVANVSFCSFFCLVC